MNMRYRNDTGRTLRLAGIGTIDPGREITFEKAIGSPLLTRLPDEKKGDKDEKGGKPEDGVKPEKKRETNETK
ncbi:MAG: hypothetical protein M0R37_13620 [Bacteroidales bacterium]|jgi:hypothetical protein|nr:hypothetical protein [Bacteroidales bacterium]